MTPSRKDIAVVSEIATAFLQGPARSVRLIGQGSNNKNFLIETAASRVVADRAKTALRLASP
jgi:hypothetical protein